MRAPSTFKSEIAAYRAKLPFVLSSDDPDVLENAVEIAARVLDNWEKHLDAEKPWLAIADHLSDDSTTEAFIFLVIRDALVAEKLRGQDAETPALEKDYRSYEKFGRKHKLYAELAYAKALRNHVRRLRQKPKLLSRKKQKAPRQYFIETWRRRFQEICGQPLEPIVGILTEIVFGGTIDPPVVRDAGRRVKRHGRKK